MNGTIKSFEERKDIKGEETFDLGDSWKSNCATLPAVAFVLRTVLTNSPNSSLPECLFNIFNTTYNLTIRKSLALTTLNYLCSHSLTNEDCRSRVSR